MDEVAALRSNQGIRNKIKMKTLNFFNKKSTYHSYQKELRGICTIVLCLSAAESALAQSALYYGIDSACQGVGPLIPNYVNGSQSYVTASTLQATGLSLSSFSDTSGLGKYWFGNWPTSNPGVSGANIGFSITPTTTIQPTTIDYTLFVGIWSGLWSGPTQFDVWASVDGFQTETLIADHYAYGDYNYLLPWADDPYTFHDDLSILGSINPGQTLSIEFVGFGEAPSNAGTPAGFSNLYADETNVIFNFNPVPEPTTDCLMAISFVGLVACSKKPKVTSA